MLRRTSKAADVSLRFLLLIIVGLLGYEVFGSRTDQISLYVAVQNYEGDQFVDRFADFMRRKRLRPAIGRATDDQGRVTVAVEAKGGNLWVWMSNVPLSGREEAPDCEKRLEPYPDPQQYEIWTRSRFQLLPGGKAKARKLAEQIERYLKQEGFLSRRDPWPCGAAAFAGRAAAYLQRR